MTNPEADEVVQHLLAAYRSFEEPRGEFVLEALESRPYQALVDELARILTVKDVTDVNCEVAFSLTVTQGPADWGLWLSMVGPYAVLIGPPAAGLPDQILVGAGRRGGTTAEQILASINAAGLETVDSEWLQQTSPLRSWQDGSFMERWQAFFIDEDEWPWEQRLRSSQAGL